MPVFKVHYEVRVSLCFFMDYFNKFSFCDDELTILQMRLAVSDTTREIAKAEKEIDELEIRARYDEILSRLGELKYDLPSDTAEKINKAHEHLRIAFDILKNIQ